MFERESLFQMLANKEWDEIAKIIYKNPDIIQSDPVTQQAVMLFENEFFTEMESLSPKEMLLGFEYPGLVIELKQKCFSKSFVARFLDNKLEALQALNSESLVNFAASHQERPLARKILEGINSKKPEVISDICRENVTVKATKTTEGYPKIINLFKSHQEENFFEAIRKSFPTYHPYPNVSLSSVLDFGAIKKELNDKERDYFFRAVIDSVVFDSSKGYRPMHFIELDSHYHDNKYAQK